MSDDLDHIPAIVRPFDDDEYEAQCEVSSVWSASRLVLLASVFLYGTFIFAYFYLRALDNDGLWRVGDEHPSPIIGTTVMILIVLAGLIHYSGARRLQVGARVDWQVTAVTSLVMIGLAIGLSVWTLTRLPFQPASSAYTGIVISWTAVNIVYLLGQFYWLETLVAQSVRRPESILSISDEGIMVVAKFGSNVEGYVLFSQFMIVAAVVMWLLFFIV